MRLGIDAKVLSKNKTGIYYYLHDILKKWSSELYDPSMEVFLYSNSPIDVDFDLPSNWKLILYKAKVGTLGVRYRLKKLLIRDKIDVFWGPDFILPKPSKKYKTVLTVHDISPFLFRKITTVKNEILMKLYLKRCCKEANEILTISDSTKQDVISIFNVEKEKVKTIYIGELSTCDNVIEEKVDFDIQPNKYILFVGSIEPRKNLANIVRSFNLIDFPDYKLVFAGGLGWRYSEILEEIDKSNKKSQIVLTGRVTEGQKKYLYKNCAFVVFASLYEGFGYPILEGYSYQKVVLTGKNSSLPEVAGPDGVYVEDVSNVAQLSNKMSWLASLSELERFEIAQKARIWGFRFSKFNCALETMNTLKRMYLGD